MRRGEQAFAWFMNTGMLKGGGDKMPNDFIIRILTAP